MQRVTRILLSLLRMDSRSRGLNGRRALQGLYEHFTENGVTDIALESRPYLFGFLAGTDNKKGLLLFSHLDTAGWNESEWQHSPLGEAHKEGLIFGRGTLDCKSLVAIHADIFMTLAEKHHRLRRPLGFIVTTDEETGGNHGMGEFCNDQDKILPFSRALGEGGGYILQSAFVSTITCQVGECGRIEFILPGADDRASIIIDLPNRNILKKLRPDDLSPLDRRRLSPESKKPSFSVKNGIGVIKIPPGFDTMRVVERLVYGGYLPSGAVAQTIAEPTLNSPKGSLYRAIKRSARMRGRRLLPAVTPGFGDARFIRAKGITAYGYFPIGSRERIGNIHAADEHIHVETLMEARDELFEIVKGTVL